MRNDENNQNSGTVKNIPGKTTVNLDFDGAYVLSALCFAPKKIFKPYGGI